MSEEPATVVQALSHVMAEVRSLGKGERNEKQGYLFRGVDATVNVVAPVLRKHGVVVVPILEEASYRDVLTLNEKRSRECTVKVRYRFYGPAGDHIDCVTPGESMDFSDKGAPKAMSVAYRIALLQALCLPTDDRDPDADHHERHAAAPATPADNARTAVRGYCQLNELDMKEVAQTYADLHETALKDDNNAARIYDYLHSLMGKQVFSGPPPQDEEQK